MIIIIMNTSFKIFLSHLLCYLIVQGLFFVNVVILVFGVLSAIPVSSDESAKFPGYPWLMVCRCGVGFGAGGATQVYVYCARLHVLSCMKLSRVNIGIPLVSLIEGIFNKTTP